MTELITEKVKAAMISYLGGDVRRISHALKVTSLAEAVGSLEGLSEEQMRVLKFAALLHDIGIKVSERKYGSSAGKYQELEGPPVAAELLKSLHTDEETIGRVCWLVGHHHTYGIDADGVYQALIEADFLVNIDEDGLNEGQAETIGEKYFKTATGKRFLTVMFLNRKKN